MTNVAHALWVRADAEPHQVVLRVGDWAWTYGELRDRSAGYTTRLRANGIVPGDRVLLVAPTSAEFAFAYFGILGAGAVAVTANTVCTQAELEYFLDDSGCRLVLAMDDLPNVPAAAASLGIPCWTIAADDVQSESEATGTACEPRVESDPAVFLYTSGTTGRPKAAVLTHGNVLAALDTFRDLIDLSPEDRLGTALPLSHVFGQVGCLALAVHVGASLSLLRPFSGAALLEMAARDRLTVLSGVPTMWNEMLHAETDVRTEDLSSLRAACSGGAALALVVADAFLERFGATVLDCYGLSETTSAGAVHRPTSPKKEGSVGQVLPGLEVKIVDGAGEQVPNGEVGEIWIRGPVVMQGYWHRPEATSEVFNGDWLRTGDLGRVDDEDYLWIVDRIKDLVIRGGYNVYPREVEEVLYSHPAIREAAVVGCPDERLNEEVAAIIALAPGASLEPAELSGWLAERLSPYKVPRIYEFVDELPKGSTGKVLKRAIDVGNIRETATHVRLGR